MNERLYIDGAWVEAPSTFPIPNPATEEVVAHAPDAGLTEMRRAIDAARRAFDGEPWRSAAPAERAAILDLKPVTAAQIGLVADLPRRHDGSAIAEAPAAAPSRAALAS